MPIRAEKTPVIIFFPGFVKTWKQKKLPHSRLLCATVQTPLRNQSTESFSVARVQGVEGWVEGVQEAIFTLSGHSFAVGGGGGRGQKYFFFYRVRKRRKYISIKYATHKKFFSLNQLRSVAFKELLLDVYIYQIVKIDKACETGEERRSGPRSKYRMNIF
jgi:hypothetical protein